MQQKPPSQHSAATAVPMRASSKKVAEIMIRFMWFDLYQLYFRFIS